MATQNASEQRPVLSKAEARQGVTGQNVRYVLWLGLAGVVILPPFIWSISFEKMRSCPYSRARLVRRFPLNFLRTVMTTTKFGGVVAVLAVYEKD
jgi:hypothetical protein